MKHTKNVEVCYTMNHPQTSQWIPTWAQAHTDIHRLTTSCTDCTARISIVNDISGTELRLRMSNCYGSKSITVVQTALQIGTGAPKILLFRGEEKFTLDAGEECYSDPIAADLHAGDCLTISIALSGNGLSGNSPNETLWHSKKGNYATRTQFPLAPRTINSFFFNLPAVLPVLESVEIRTTQRPRVIACIGNSITQQGQWTNPLREMLRAHNMDTVILNKGIGGNRLLRDAGTTMGMYGQSAVNRFAHDGLEEPGVTDIIIEQGTNDLAMAKDSAELAQCNAEKLSGALVSLAEQAKAHGIRVYVATVTPRGGTKGWTAEREQERQKLNAWIRSCNRFDGVLDYDAVTRDSQDPQVFAACCDSGDHLHPGPMGGRLMAWEAYRVLINRF